MSLLIEEQIEKIDLDAGLSQLGFDSFRPGQREAVETLMSDGRLLLVAPTGGGKSLTYQLPAAILPGTTIVVSPLIALMKDQVDGLTLRDISATYINSSLGLADQQDRLRRMAAGDFHLVYVAPERMRSEASCSVSACFSQTCSDFMPITESGSRESHNSARRFGGNKSVRP